MSNKMPAATRILSRRQPFTSKEQPLQKYKAARNIVSLTALIFLPATKGSLKNNFTFYTPMHLFRLRCESSEFPDIPAFSRLRMSRMTNLF
jgi:hypothetical protein